MSNSAYTIRVIKGGMTVSRLTVPSQAGARGEAVTLVVESGASYQISQSASNLGPTKIRARRAGSNLWISVDGADPNQPDVIIQGYFDLPRLPMLLGVDSAGEVGVYSPADVSPLAALHGMSKGGAPALDDELHLGGKAAASLIDGVSDTTLLWGGVAVGGLLLYKAVNKDSSPESSPIDAVKAYADNPLATAPSVSTYSTAGVRGVDGANLDAINSVVQTLKSVGIPDVAKLQKVVDTYNRLLAKADGLASADPAKDALVAADYETLGVKLQSLDKVDLGLALLNDVIDLSTVRSVDTVGELTKLADSVAKVFETINGTGNTLVFADINALGVGARQGSVAASATNLDAVKSALGAFATATEAARIDRVGEIQSIVTAYDKILKYADGPAAVSLPGNAPTVQDYADVRADIGIAKTGAVGASTTVADNALRLLGEVVGASATTAVDTVKEIGEIGKAIDHLMALASTSVVPAKLDLTSADLALLGITVSGSEQMAPAKFDKLWKAISESPNDGSGVNSLTQIRTLVTDAMEGLSATEALAALRTWTSSGATAPAQKTYEAAGVTGVTLNNVDAINSAVLALEPVDVNTTEKVQKVVAAYVRILAEANGSSLPDPTPLDDLTYLDYKTVGTSLRTLESSPTALTFLNDVIENRPITAVDSVADTNGLNGIVMSVEKVIDTLNGSPLGLSLSLSDYGTLGVVDGAGRVVTTTLSNLNPDAILSSLKIAPKTGDAAIDTLGELQAIATGFERILAYADGSSIANQPASGPKASDYSAVFANIGLAANGVLGAVNTLADNSLRLLNEAVGMKSTTGVDSVAEINRIAEAVDHVMALAAMNRLDSYSGQLTGADLSTLGVSVGSNNELVNTEQFKAFWSSVANTANTGAGVGSLSQLQALYTASLTI